MESSSSSSSTSSIGRNSDDESLREGEEVESNLNEGALNTLQELEQLLPIKRSLSDFYDGKTKSFNNLKDAEATSSVREIAKPETAYTRRRRNLVAHHCLSERNPLGVNRSNGGVSKRRAKSTSMSTLAATLCRSESCNNCDSSNANVPSPETTLSNLEGEAAGPSIPERK